MKYKGNNESQENAYNRYGCKDELHGIGSATVLARSTGGQIYKGQILAGSGVHYSVCCLLVRYHHHRSI